MIKAARLLLGLIFSAFCLWLVVENFLDGSKLTQVLNKIKGVNIIWIFLSLGIWTLSYPLNTLRLRYILSAEEHSTYKFMPIFTVVWASSFFSLVVPSTAFSDGIRAALLRAGKISNLSLAIRSVLVDRLMGLIFIFGIAGLLLLLTPVSLKTGLNWYWGLIFLSIFSGVIVFIYLGSKIINKLVNKFKPLNQVRNLFNDMHRLLSSYKTAIYLVGFAVANTMISSLSLWCIAKGFINDVNFIVFLVLTPSILIVNNLPIFYQGFGGREATMLFAFGSSHVGMNSDLIITISLVSGILMMVSALIGSVFVPFLFMSKKEGPLVNTAIK